jgi:hypothetical protein
MMSVILLRVFMLSVGMLNVAAPFTDCVKKVLVRGALLERTALARKSVCEKQRGRRGKEENGR